VSAIYENREDGRMAAREKSVGREYNVDFRLAMLCIAGWCFVWTWLCLFPSSLQPYRSLLNGVAMASLVSLVSFGVMAAARGVLFLAAEKLDGYLNRPGWGIASSGLVTLGTALVFSACYLNLQIVLPIVVVGTVATALGVVWLSTSWVAVFARMSDTATFAYVLAGFFLGAFVSLSFTQVPTSLGMALVAAFPLVSGVCHYHASRLAADAADHGDGLTALSDRTVAPIPRTSYVACLVLAILCFGLAGTVVRSFANSMAIGNAELMIHANNWHLLGMGFCTLAVSVLVLARSLRGKPVLYSSLNKGVMVALALGMLVPGLLPEAPLHVSNFIVGAAIGCFEVVILVYAASVSRNLQISPFRTLGVAYGSMELACFAGTPLSRLLEDGVVSGSMHWSSISILFLFMFVVIAMFIVIPFDGLTLRFGKRSQTDEDIDLGAAPDCEGRPLASLLQERYGLTDRETEVAVLLAEGCNIPFIQEKLIISKGTAQTHSYNIYRKMGIHKRKELIDIARKLNQTK